MSYQRNQVAWAIARCLSLEAKPNSSLERDVALRVQRLIDTDRALETDTEVHETRAFLGDNLPGTGTVASFSDEDAFRLLLGLLLLQMGVTQSRVIRILRDLHDPIGEHYRWLISFPLASLRAGRSDDIWSKDLELGRLAVKPEHQSFLVARTSFAGRGSEVTAYLCRIHGEMIEAIDRLSPDPEPLMVIELTNKAMPLWYQLASAPRVTRGRRPKPPAM